LWAIVLWLGIAAAAGVTLAIVTHPSLSSDKPRSATLASQAAALIERGNPAGAIKILDAAKDQIQHDPQAQLQLGHALAATRVNARALDAYMRALDLSPGLEADAALRSNLIAMTKDDDPKAIARAFELLLVRTRAPTIQDQLLAAAVDADMQRRTAVLPLIEKLGLGEGVDWLVVYALDLEQGGTCERRRPAVAKLRALGDARAIPLLEKAMVRKGKKNRLVNQCLVEDAAAALTYLRELLSP